MKRELCWIAAITLFWAGVSLAPRIFGWQFIDGFSGLVINFFLGYCALILVAQVYSALTVLRSLLGEAAKGKGPSRQVLLRAEEQPISPEE